jgi:probable rRNA maturation factor
MTRSSLARLVRSLTIPAGVDSALRAGYCSWARAEPIDSGPLRSKERNHPAARRGLAGGPAGTLHAALLGDIVISVVTARRQARRGLYRELLHLASHGLCHLLGHDHRDDAEEREMNARAAALRDEAGRRGRVRAA